MRQFAEDAGVVPSRLSRIQQGDEASTIELSLIVDELQKLFDARCSSPAVDCRDKVVWGFYEEEHPLYTQGREGEHEICSPLTANEANGLVSKIVVLEKQKQVMTETLARTLGWKIFPYALPGKNGGEWKWCPPGAKVHISTATTLPSFDQLVAGIPSR